MNILQRLLGKGFVFAKDAKPEDIVAASRAIAVDEESNTDGDRNQNPTLRGPKQLVGKRLVGAGKDKDGNELFRAVALDDDVEAEQRAALDARRKRMHDMLDRMYADDDEKAKERSEQDDADLGELKRLMNQFLGEEEKEGGAHDDDGQEHEREARDDDAHPEGCRCDDCKDDNAADDAEIVRAEPTLPPEERPKSAFDAAFTLELMRMVRPLVAKADQKTRKRFARMFDALKAELKDTNANNGSYSGFRKAASTASDEIGKDGEESPAQKAAREYDEKMKKLREESRKRSLEAHRRR